MRVYLIILSVIFSFQIQASEDAEMKLLFQKYEQIVKDKKIELIDEVFSKKYLAQSGGKEEIVKSIKELPLEKENTVSAKNLQWRKGVMGKIYFAKHRSPAKDKSKDEHGGSEFMVIQEDGKLKIDGTISDLQ